jgi:hypothetical protein
MQVKNKITSIRCRSGGSTAVVKKKRSQRKWAFILLVKDLDTCANFSVPKSPSFCLVAICVDAKKLNILLRRTFYRLNTSHNVDGVD